MSLIINSIQAEQSATVGGIEAALRVSSVVYVKKNPGPGEFSSIKDAVDSILDATSTNQYEVSVGPGVYVEDTIDLKPFVHFTGTYGTIIEASDPSNDVFTCSNASTSTRIKFFTIRGATSTGSCAIRCTLGSVSVLNVIFGNNDILCSSECSAGLAFITLSNISVSSTFTTGFRALASGGAAIIAIASSSINLTSAPDDVFYITGPGSQLILSSSLVQGAIFLTGANGVRVSDGAVVRSSGIGFANFAKAVFVENVGAAPDIQVDASTFNDCTTDADIAHTSATGFISRPSRTKTFLDPSNTVFVPNTYPNVITVAKRGGNFSSIGAALAYITDNSEMNPYVVSVAPGVYVEDTLVMKPYVDVIGQDRNVTIIEVDDPSKDVVTMAGRVYLSDVTLRGATDPGSAAIRFTAVNSSEIASTISNCVFGSNDTLVRMVSDAFSTNLIIQRCAIPVTSSFDVGFDVEALGSARTALVVSNLFCNLNNVSYYGRATGVCSLYIVENIVVGLSGCDTFVSVSNGATAGVRSNSVSGFVTGIEAQNVGSAPTLAVADCTLNCSTYDLLVSHPGTLGFFTGVADNTRVSVDPSSPVLLRYADPFAPTTGSVSLGDLYQGSRHDRLVNFSKLSFATATLGLFDGGVISYVSGTTVSVSAGSGFLLDQANNYLKEVTWSTSNLVVPTNTTRYIYINDSGVVSQSSSPPSEFNSIFLGRASVDSGLVFIEQSQISQVHHNNLLESYARDAIGPIYSTGSQVVQSGTGTRNLDISSGIYYYGTRKFVPSGANNASFTTYLRNGSGGYIKTSGVQTVPDAYDNNSGTPVTLASGKFAKHALYIIGDGANEKYLLQYSQIEYDTLIDAEGGNIPTHPAEFESAIALIATVIVESGNSTISEIRDERPVIGFKASGVSAAAVHGNLLGLLVDDHPQYLLVDGTRAMSGSLDMGANSITNVNLVDGVDVSAHASRHLPNGLDPITTAAGVMVSAATTNAVGTANSLARSDHGHAVSTGAASSQTPDQANAAGTSANLARADHIHNIATAAPSADLSATTTNSQGAASSFSRSDHGHAISTGAASTQNPDQTNAAGTSVNLARADHVHNIPTASAVDISDSTNAQGSSSSFARADHVHSHGSRAGGTLHAAATTSVAGFMSASDKAFLDSIGQHQSASSEPTGFENRTSSSISIDEGTRTFTITPSPSFNYWIAGVRYTVAAPSSVVFADVEGIHYIYFQGSILIDDPSPPAVSLLKSVAYISAFYWNQTAQEVVYFADERHGIDMDGTTHEYLHFTQGTKFVSGLALSNFSIDGDGNSNANAQFDCADGVIKDEDIEITITDGSPQDLTPIANIPVYYRTGASGLWRKKAADAFPIIYSGTAGYTGASGRLPFNEFSGGEYTLTEAATGNFVLVHYFATNDIDNPVVGIQGTSQYNNIVEARDGATEDIKSLTGLPFEEFTPVGTVIFQTATGYTNTPKARIVSTFDGSDYMDWRDTRILSSGSATDHGSLGGLADDDHPQYLLVSGTRAMSGNLDMGGNSITNVNLVDGVDVSAHASRHLPAGADPLTTAAAVTLNANSTNTIGTANSLARSDHTHDIDTAAPITTLSPATTNAEGTGASLSRNDHTHAVATATSGVLSTVNAGDTAQAGTSDTFTRGDHQHPVATAAASTLTPDLANAEGVSTSLARADHIHNVPADAPTTSLSATTTNAEGTGSSFSRNDHTHAILTAAPVSQTPDQINATGTASTLARSDHVHNIATDAPSTPLSATTTNAEGTAPSFARADHTHSITTGAASTQNPDQANAAGTSANLARADHVHNIPTATAVSVASTNAQGVSTSFARADHVHQGVHSVKVGVGGTERYGDLTLVQGDNTTIVDSGGTFTVHSYAGKATVNTTDGTLTTAATITTADNTVTMIEAFVVGRRTGGVSGSLGDSAAYIRKARVSNIAGAATLFTLQTDYTSEDQNWNATLDVLGADIRIRVQGAAGNNVSWACTYRIYTV